MKSKETELPHKPFQRLCSLLEALRARVAVSTGSLQGCQGSQKLASGVQHIL